MPTAPFPYAAKRHAPDMPWPPRGLRLSINTTAPASALPAHKNVVVTVHYELYSGAPIMAKWLQISVAGGEPSATARKAQLKDTAAPKSTLPDPHTHTGHSTWSHKHGVDAHARGHYSAEQSRRERAQGQSTFSVQSTCLSVLYHLEIAGLHVHAGG